MKATRTRSRMPLLAFFLTLGLLLGARSYVDAAVFSFDFDDEYYIDNLTTFTNVFGAGATGYTLPGIYQQTNTGSTAIARLSGGHYVPGEYVANSTPDRSQFLFLSGWGQGLHNGQAVGSVSNQANPMTGMALFFRFVVDGLAIPFELMRFDIAGWSPDANFSFTIEGLQNGSVVRSAVETVTGNDFRTVVLNWQDVDAVAIVSTAALPLNWSSGVLTIDNLVIDPPAEGPPAVTNPEPGTLLLMGLGSLGALFARRRLKTV